jgi:hypothetical protein
MMSDATLDLEHNSVADSGQIDDPLKRHGRSRVTNGSALLPGVDGRSTWCRRFRDVLAEHLSDVPDASVAERSILRRAAALVVELEKLERQFALAEPAVVDAETIDLYQRTANSLRRLLESIGLQRRPKDANTIDAGAERLLAYLKDPAP